MSNGGNKPKPAFFVAVGAVVLGLLAFSYWRCSAKKADEKAANVDMADIKKQAGNNEPAEDPTGKAQTTVKDYAYEPSSVLPEVPGTADYKSIGKKRIVKFAINIWAGWAPIIYANGGKGPGKVWKDAKGEEFQVELVLIDKPVDMGNTFAAGEVHIGWATVDMLPLVVQRLNNDPRSMPRVFQQVDWSNGGDGIVVHTDIKTIADLRGKTVVLAQNSPSHYFLLNALLNGGVQPTEVKMEFTQDAFQAAAAFNSERKYAGVVTWAPDIYTLKDVPGNKLLLSTLDASKLIADVWFARADFARDNPDIIEGLVRGIFDATDVLSADKSKHEETGKLMDGVYGLPAGSGLAMMYDAHWTNYAENKAFFMNANNPTNFERTYNTAFLLYKAIGALDINKRVPFDQIMDFSVIKKLGDDPKYAASKDTYTTEFSPATSKDINVESAVITKTVVIAFCPNRADPFQVEDGQKCDLNAQNTIDSIGQLAGQYGNARIQIEGHTDGTKKGVADESQVRELSFARANAVKAALIKTFPDLPPNQFVTAGFGWDKPADPTDPDNHAKNRRVEVRVIPAEAM